VTDAYVTWALVEAGEKDLAAEVASLVAAGGTSDDPYVVALAALVAARTGDAAGTTSLLARLATKQGKDGAVEGARTSITGSGGDALKIEATSLAILAWLSQPARAAEVERAMQWLSTRCQDGRFGSTQATILALRAIIAYDASRARPKEGGKVRLLVDGKAVETLPFEANHEGALVLPDVGARLGAGSHRVALELEGGSAMPYSLAVRYHARTPASSPETKVDVVTEATRTEAKEGDPVDVPVVVRNRTAEGVPMVVAIVGLPGGLEARVDALKELVREGKADAYETRGREVILYWRGLGPNASKAVVLPCVAAIPGRYTGPASRAYLYYTDEHKAWVPGLSLSITPR
jgi:alpha-2-macroglobulin-like protein